MLEVAEEELDEARELLALAEPELVRFVVARGDAVRAITATAAEVGADCVILAPEATHRVPLPWRRSVASRLGAERGFTVLTAPLDA